MPFVARTLSPETSSIIETIADNPNSARRFFPSFVFAEWLSKFFKSPLPTWKKLDRPAFERSWRWRGEERKKEKDREVRCRITFMYRVYVMLDGRRYVSSILHSKEKLFNWLFIEEIFYIVIKRVS